jgi:hypothetical protein
MKSDDKYLDPRYNPFIPKSEPADGDSSRGGDRYLNPKTNPFLPQDEPERKSSPEPDGRAPFEPIGKVSEASLVLSSLLEKEFPGGGIVEIGGIKFAKLLGGWATEDGRRIEALPSEDLERIEAAIREKERG